MSECVCVCVSVPEAQGTCDVLPIAQLRTTLADVLIIDALIAGRRFLPRHINHIPTQPPTLHTHRRQAANTIAQWENKKNFT